MFYCEWCEKKYDNDEVDAMVEDNTFSAPFGSFKVVIGGSIDKIETCPECGMRIEEVEE